MREKILTGLVLAVTAAQAGELGFLKPHNIKTSATVYYGGGPGLAGKPGTLGAGMRSQASIDLGDHLVATHVLNEQAGGSWGDWFGKAASLRLKAPIGFQPGVSVFRRPDLVNGGFKVYECLDLTQNAGVKIGPVGIRASASYLLPTNYNDQFLIGQVSASIPHIGEVRSFVNNVFRTDQRLYEIEWTKPIHEGKCLQYAANVQYDQKFNGRRFVRAGLTVSRK